MRASCVGVWRSDGRARWPNARTGACSAPRPTPRTEVNGFGGGRGHQGQDIFATCGTPLVSARSGIVTVATSEARAGNYTVITADDWTSQAYMHMLEPATVVRDQRVTAGQPIGQVGQSGRATGCDLHFELWTAPGWYEGGTAVDPLPELQQYATRG